MEDQLLAHIEEALEALAQEEFDPEEATDSDGLDQSRREGVEMALQKVKEVFAGVA